MILIFPLLAGCLSSAPKAPANWTIGPIEPQTATSAPKWAEARLVRLDVRAPYDGRRLAVLRPNGSVAFDAFNVFAAAPAALLRGAAQDILAARTAVAGPVPNSVGPVPASVELELTVTRLALDARAKGARKATVALSLARLDGRHAASVVRAEAAEPVASGDYSAAFSAAFAKALADAIDRI